MMKRSSQLLCAAIALSLSITTSAAIIPNGIQLAETQSITMGNGFEPGSLDPQLSEAEEDFRIQRDLYEGLVIQDDMGGMLPGQAESWTISPDYKTFTFKIRDDAFWSNGDKVTARDFVSSWQRLVSPETASPYSWYVEMTMISNAADIIRGKKEPETLGVRALDDKTLQITLDQSVPYLLNMLTLPVMSPVHISSIEKYGRDWTQPGNIVNNGAYTLQDWIVNERVTMKRNSRYWNDKDTVLDIVNIVPVGGNAGLNRYKAGDIQIAQDIPIEHYKSLLKQKADEVIHAPTISTAYYIFNMEVKPFDDVRVRKALSYAIDREVIAEKIMGQGQKAAYTLTPDSVHGFTPPVVEYQQWTQQQRDEKARELLAEAGYGKDNPLKVELLYNTNDGNKRQAVIISQMWKKMGVETTLKNQEWKSMLDSKRLGDFEIIRGGWTADYNDASSMLDLLTSSHGSNAGNYFNPAYDDLMKEAKLSATSEKRNLLYAEAEKVMAEDIPILPIYFSARVLLQDTSVGGFPKHNPQSAVYSKNLYRIKQP